MSTNPSSQKGHCLCGSVHFTAEKVEPHYHACHCGMCRRWSGGPLFAASAEHVTFTGEENITRYNSSDWAERGFCKKCGSNIFYHIKGTEQYVLMVGTFEDDSAFSMEGEIFCDTKPKGYEFAGDHERLTEAETMAKFAPS